MDFIRKMCSQIIGKSYDNFALQLLELPQQHYMPWTSSAMRPGALACILNDLEINHRTNIVEFGSGISTIFIAQCLAQHKGRQFHSFDHDPQWANYISSVLRELGLQDAAKVIVAPMRPCKESPTNSPWYDSAVIYETLESQEIDLLLCDGPPAHAKHDQMVRYPAVPILKNQLAENYSIFLDDIHRKSERRIAHEWGKMLGVPFRSFLLEGSFAHGVKGPHHNFVI